VYRCADLWRTFVLVVALSLTAVSTGALAREFRSPDPQYASHPIDLFHSRRPGVEPAALEHIGTGAPGFNRTQFALIGTMAPPLAGRLRGVERI
jgi:hypothetical protein